MHNAIKAIKIDVYWDIIVSIKLKHKTYTGLQDNFCSGNTHFELRCRVDSEVKKRVCMKRKRPVILSSTY